MRTTLSLDPDVAARLQRRRERGDRSFKELVNDLLRIGLAHEDDASMAPSGPFTRVVSLGSPRLPDLDDVSEALAVAEGDGYR